MNKPCAPPLLKESIEASEAESGDMSVAEINEVLSEVIRSLKFHKAMIADLLQIATDMDPESIGLLRTQAAVELDRVHADRHSDPLADERESFWRHRFMMLDTVLAHRGSYFRTAEVVNLDAARG